MIFRLEVDVAVRRPPSAANSRTHHALICVPDDLTITRAENEARFTAIAMALGRRPSVMATAVRIISAEL